MINSATSFLNHPISLAKDAYASATKNKQTLVKGAVAIAGLTAIAAGLYFYGPDMAKYCSTTKPAKPGTPTPTPQSTSTTKPTFPRPTPTPSPVPTPPSTSTTQPTPLPPQSAPTPSPVPSPQNTSTTQPPCPSKSSTLQNIIDFFSPSSPQPSLNQSSVGSPEKVIEILSSQETSVTILPQDNQVSNSSEASFGSKFFVWISGLLPSTEFTGPPTSDEPIAEILDQDHLFPTGTSTNPESLDSSPALQESSSEIPSFESIYNATTEFFSSLLPEERPPLSPKQVLENERDGWVYKAKITWKKISKALSEIEKKNENSTHLLGSNENLNEPTWLKSKINTALSDAWSAASNFEPEQYLAEKRAEEIKNMQLFSSNVRSLGEFISTSASNLKNSAENAVNEFSERRNLVSPKQALEYERDLWAPYVTAVKQWKQVSLFTSDSYNAISPVVRNASQAALRNFGHTTMSAIQQIKDFAIIHIPSLKHAGKVGVVTNLATALWIL